MGNGLQQPQLLIGVVGFVAGGTHQGQARSGLGQLGGHARPKLLSQLRRIFQAAQLLEEVALPATAPAGSPAPAAAPAQP
ncbi:MAG: hypothetical protein EBU42_03565 [Synechococcus sp.]|nr:hypothetical protein [Synechococcus sp.]